MVSNYKGHPSAQTEGFDMSESSIFQIDEELLKILLVDRTTRKNILWATKDYESLGLGFEEKNNILPAYLTGIFDITIQPRIMKNTRMQSGRTKEKAEVFTPSWICNRQNNLVDKQWFGREDVFNRELPTSWVTTKWKIDFSHSQKTWEQYVDAKRLEVSCGEAPYLVSRYDTVTGEFIPLEDRIGLLDRKLRIVKENTVDNEEWLKWTLRAFQSVYGYEFQGDNLLLARCNLLYTFLDHYHDSFDDTPDFNVLKQIAHIISWNLWQMDGLNYVVPHSCTPIRVEQISLFDMDALSEACPGCRTQQHHLHNGHYARIHDWRSNRSQTFFSLVKGSEV